MWDCTDLITPRHSLGLNRLLSTLSFTGSDSHIGQAGEQWGEGTRPEGWEGEQCAICHHLGAYALYEPILQTNGSFCFPIVS